MFTYAIDEDTVLKLLDIEDAKALFALTDANREHLRKWLPWVDHTRSVADSRVFIESTKKKFADHNGFEAGIWFRGELAGVAGFHEVDWTNGKTTLGYWLGARYQGHGLMTKTCRVLIRHAFQSWNLNRIEIRCGVENVKSCAIPERLGFTKEGTIRGAERLHDRFVSHHVYGLLKSEWAGRF